MLKLTDHAENYHANKAFGSSAIVSGYNSKTGEINLAKVKSYLDKQNEVSASLQKIFDLGTVQHSVVLEQDTSIAKVIPEFAPIPGKTAKEQKEEFHAKKLLDPELIEPSKFKPIPGITKKSQQDEWKAQNPAKYYLKKAEYDSICSAFDVISSHEEASRMISNALDIETSYYLTDEGLKARPDIVGMTDNGAQFICNYKTINDLEKCDSHIYSHKLDIRAAHELYVVSKFHNEPISLYFLLFQQKTAPYSIECYQISDLDMEIAHDEWLKCKNTINLAMKNNYWPQPPFKIKETKVYRSFKDDFI